MTASPHGIFLAVQQCDALLCTKTKAHGPEVQCTGENGHLRSPGGWVPLSPAYALEGVQTGMGMLGFDDHLCDSGVSEPASWSW